MQPKLESKVGESKVNLVVNLTLPLLNIWDCFKIFGLMDRVVGLLWKNKSDLNRTHVGWIER